MSADLLVFRNYQQSIYDQVAYSLRHLLVQLDTGGGKTPIIAKVAKLQPTICIAHRNMLVEQISGTLNHIDVDHQIIGSPKVRKRCQLSQRHAGVNYRGDVYVASVQTLIRRHNDGKLPVDRLLPFKIIIDEAHHTAKDNIWAQLKDVFPNATFLGFTATPCRLDGQGLHVDDGGLFEEIVQAEQLKENSTATLIAQGYLSDYVAYCPPAQIDWAALQIGSLKDYTSNSMEQAINKARICGDVVRHYLKYAAGKRSLVFAVSIANAEMVCQSFKNAKVSSSYIASTLSDDENMRRIDAFRAGEFDVLVNVEMATEGFDLPEIQCVQMLRPTVSFGLYRQMVGRVLRPKPDGSLAIIIDHAANILRHGLPDDNIEWNLRGWPINKSEPVINCAECHTVHNAYLLRCPVCGKENWLRHAVCLNDPIVKAQIIKVDLVRKIRSELQALAMIQDKAEAERARTELLNTVHLAPTWRYPKGAMGDACTQLAQWMFDSLKDHITPKEMNAFTQSSMPPIDFWTKHFTMNDLRSPNPNKCKKAMKSWRSK